MHPPCQEPNREGGRLCLQPGLHTPLPAGRDLLPSPAGAWEGREGWAGELQKFITFHMTQGSVGFYQSPSRFPSLKTGKNHKNN